MSANNCIYINKIKEGWAIYDQDVENEDGYQLVGIRPSLEVAIRKANRYMKTHEVEYGLQIDL